MIAFACAAIDYEEGKKSTVFDFRSDYHRADIVVRKRVGPWRFMVSPAFRYDIGRRQVPLQMADQSRRDYVTSLRAEGVRELSDRFELVFGADAQIDAFKARAVGSDPNGVLDQEPKELRGTETWLGVYTTARLRLGPLLLTPGVRAAGFVVGQ